MVVGSKIDLANEREVSTEEGQELATKLGCLFAEVSATDGSTIMKAFDKIVDEINISNEPETVKQVSSC